MVVPNGNGLGPQGQTLVKAATTGGDVDTLELIIVNSINANGVLGVAGGIPGSTGIPGTPHSGAIVVTDTFCDKQFGSGYTALVGAHELGHTIGLFHNTEMDGHHSPLGDDVASGSQNLMYWRPTAARTLSTNQRAVIGPTRRWRHEDSGITMLLCWRCLTATPIRLAPASSGCWRGTSRPTPRSGRTARSGRRSRAHHHRHRRARQLDGAPARDRRARRCAVQAGLELLRATSAAPRRHEGLPGLDVEVCARTLPRFGESVFRDLVALLTHPAVDARRLAAAGLAQLGLPEARAPLSLRLAAERDPDVQAALVRALAHSTTALTSPDPRPRRPMASLLPLFASLISLCAGRHRAAQSASGAAA